MRDKQELWLREHVRNVRIQYSVVICTHNRNPYPLEHVMNNPLSWLLLSILGQEYSDVKEVVLVDDVSEDYIEDTIRYFKPKYSEKKIEFKYLKNMERKPLNEIRNLAIERCEGEWIVFADDDCILSDYYLVSASYYISRYQTGSLGAIVPPCFYRNHIFTRQEKIIGKVDMKQCKFYANFNAFPKEYIMNPQYEADGTLYRPLSVDFINGVSIVRADVAKKVKFRHSKGFSWDYGDWIDFGYSMKELGIQLLYVPNPCAYVIHFKYGARGNYDTLDEDIRFEYINKTLKELIDLSSIENINTGQRCFRNEYFRNEIGGLFSFFYTRNVIGAVQWMMKTYHEFVEENIVYNRIYSDSGLTYDERKRVWENAIGTVLLNR